MVSTLISRPRKVSGQQLFVSSGGFDVGGVPVALFDAKGDLLLASADNTPGRLGVGADGQGLIADSTQTLGARWRAIMNPYNVNASSSQTTTSTADPFTATVGGDMSITQDFGPRTLLCIATAMLSNSGAGNSTRMAIYNGSSEIGQRNFMTGTVADLVVCVAVVTVAAGSRTISARWNVTAGTGTVTRRALDILAFP